MFRQLGKEFLTAALRLFLLDALQDPLANGGAGHCC
jgi:hypothetical protein